MRTRILQTEKTRAHLEPNIGLINVVFLLLMFFLLAGRIAPELQGQLALLDITGEQNAIPDGAIAVDENGQIYNQNGTIELIDIERLTDKSKLRIAPDRHLKAQDFAELLSIFEAQGWQEIAIIGERQR